MNKELASFDLILTPHGTVTVLAQANAPLWARTLVARFTDGEAPGLIALGAILTPPQAAPPAISFWQEIAGAFLRTVCHVPPDKLAVAATDIEPPSPALLAQWVLSVPPMTGAEYISVAVLEGIWMRLTAWATEQAARSGGWGTFLETYAPRWTRVGRVTLHLAENKGDEGYPFTFMATYAAGLSSAGRVQRLPLGRALQMYAGTQAKPELLRLLSPLHAAAKKSSLITDLVESGDIFHPLAWTPAEAYSFLSEIPLYEECGLLAHLPDWWHKRPRPKVNVTLDTRKGTAVGADALLEFNLNIALDGKPLSEDETAALLNASEGLIFLRGQWVEANPEKLREALEHWREVERQAEHSGLSFAEGMRLLAGAPADLKEETGDTRNDWSSVSAGERLHEALRGLREPQSLGGNTPEGFSGTLRGYQSNGLNWLDYCARLGLGGCLADDMGLGKTIQILAALLRERARTGTAERCPSLLVVPASLVANWKAEATRFAPALCLFLAHPSETPANLLANGKAIDGCDLVVTTYGMLSRLPSLTERVWHWIILDEAQAIKNPSTVQTRAVKKLQGAARFALTGTPVENHLGDLWSIFDFLNPGLLGSAQRFKSFVKILDGSTHANYAPLRNLVSPYILRRLKTDPAIVPDLPEKIEMPAYCGLSNAQAVLYRRQVDDLRSALETTASDKMRRRGLVLAYLMRFKQICNHPSQFLGDGLYAPENSAKFQRLSELCSEIAGRGEKVLIFTQFRELTEPLAEFLAGVFGRKGLVLHGGTAVKHRRSLVEAFQREDGPPFFVLSIKAGGTGLNLTEASHVIHVDRWWNPAVENQATDRAFRIGQKRNVLVHKFVTRGTVEEKIDAMIREKRNLADAVLDGGTEKALTEMSDEEVLRIVALDIDHTVI